MRVYGSARQLPIQPISFYGKPSLRENGVKIPAGIDGKPAFTALHSARTAVKIVTWASGQVVEALLPQSAAAINLSGDASDFLYISALPWRRLKPPA